MVNYRRNIHPGGTFFFTLNLKNRRSTILVDHIDHLRHVFRRVKTAAPFTINAVVILPDHLHAIWTLPENDADYPGRWRAIKSTFVRRLKRDGIHAERNAKGEAGIWQRRYWEHTIRNEQDLARHIDYIHFNPAKHGHVKRPANWPYSSIHEFIRCGDLPKDWGGPDTDIHGAFGE